ncbi:MAG: ornithine carbamoyltransferase [Defluviitaleaceae bacterium]|nr:ornithine carbamoyltransferase [Defluviitaleaceae bacterium]
MKKNLLKLLDLTKEEILEILSLADQMKYNLRHGIAHRELEGKTLAMIFEKASTRTRVSFETGMYQLGGYALFLSSADLQIGRGEPIQDTARVLARYADGIMMRTFGQSIVEDFAKWADIPVINGLTDFEHPCQILADLMTIREYHGTLEGLKVAYIGDGNNVCNSLIVGSLICGMKISVATPKGYEPHKDILEFAKKYDTFELVNCPTQAAQKADAVYTDVWASMGMEDEANKRIKDFDGFQVNAELMKQTNANSIVLHCLPAHREEEITAEVFEQHASSIFDEAENRLHAQKAVMALLMRGEK